MVLGQADRPLLQRHLNVTDPQVPVTVDGLLAAVAAEYERSGICRVSQEVVHRSIAGSSPADPTLPDRPPRELLALVEQLHHDLARGPDTPPEHEDALDRVTDLLIGAQHDLVVIVAIQADRQR
jgi:hypothetical protein